MYIEKTVSRSDVVSMSIENICPSYKYERFATQATPLLLMFDMLLYVWWLA